MNEHITEYLNYYIRLPKAPQFAVMLKGNWGCGKSFYINKFIEDNGREKFLYISLYGVGSTREINEQIFEQLNPVLASKGMKIVRKVFTSVLKTALKINLSDSGEVEIDPDLSSINLPDYLTNADKKIIVFDDLERCTMDLAVALGYINQFVENNGNKVLIVANEQEIISNEEKREKKRYQNIKGKFDNKTFEGELGSNELSENVKYLRTKEKLIGKSFEVKSNFDEALNEFITDLQNQAFINLLNQKKSLIKELYSAAGYNNLRHLKQTILDLERLYLLLPPIAHRKENLIIDLISLFLAISFELKKGNIKEEDILNLFAGGHPLLFDNKDSIFQKLRETYSIESFPLNSNLWFDFFSKGIISNRDELEQSIRNSRYFLNENTPAHIKLWSWTDLSDDEFETLFQNVYNYFQNEEVEDQHLLVHITSMLVYYSEINLIPIAKSQIISLAKKNVTNLRTQGKLSFNYNDGFSVDAYGSLGYHGRDIQQFKDFIVYLKKEAQKYIISNYPNEASTLLTEMKNSPLKFAQKLTLSNTSENKYYNIPILKHFAVKDFVNAFLTLSNEHKKHIGSMIRERYRHLELAAELKDELKWLKKVNEELNKEQKKRINKPSGFILKGIAEHYLAPSIQVLESINSN
ncbi:P-loop NTPase fold protein [Niastella populi]|uniref:KAP NTPase domain-containing protein n=1 Tax=Niastella populi TaxID=550983 RepID=A0A1V9GAP7_9BACT|nr:P-loop NTPase fold protein [Niastella populi]OQP67632.1 hypothetical protein A4R26_33140 [Niastella populi]